MIEVEKIAIVTGGGSGLGFGIAEKFVAAGITTIIVGRDAEKLTAAQEKLGPGAIVRPCDLNDLKSIPPFIEGLIQEFGKIDILVNNAGINMKKDFVEVTDEDFHKVMTTNLSAVFSITREVVKDMLKRENGCIINISSMAAQYGLPRVIAYSSSKTAIEGFTRAMASELSGRGIRVNCIAPGFIETPMTAKALNDDPVRKGKAIGRTPMGKMGKPADIGGAALYLASEDAGFVTGAVLCVDGGNSIGF